MKFLVLFLSLLSINSWSQSNMRRCTMLPVTDSVGGAIGLKVFDQVERHLKQSNWCTYISNASMINVFSRYRDNLQQHLKQKEVLRTIGDKLKAGSLIRINLVSEITGMDVQLDVVSDNGEDIYFSESSFIKSDDVELISDMLKNWLEVYSKTIPYDAKVNGTLGEQVTLDVGKGYPIREGQKFIVKRFSNSRKHPLLKKIVDWDAEVLAEGTVLSISDNQALGMIKNYQEAKKVEAGDWIRLGPLPEKDVVTKKEEEANQNPGTLGLLSIGLTTASSSVDTTTPDGNKRIAGYLFGIDARGEAWITRNYFAGIQLARSIGTLKKDSGSVQKKSVATQSGNFKLMGGYKYLPIGFFYGPQVDFYAGLANYNFDLAYSQNDGYGQGKISGLLLGVSSNIPISRLYRLYARAEFLPFPKFKSDDGFYSSAKNVSALDLELGLRYYYTPYLTVDGAIQTFSGGAKFDGSYKEFSYHDNMKLKLGASFNF